MWIITTKHDKKYWTDEFIQTKDFYVFTTTTLSGVEIKRSVAHSEIMMIEEMPGTVEDLQKKKRVVDEEEN